MGDVRGGLRHFHRDVELDAGIAQPLAEPACHQHKGGFGEMSFAQSFIVIVAGVELRQIDRIRLMRHAAFEGIDAFLCLRQQGPRI